MLKFLLQTVNGKTVHDFVFEFERAVEYQRRHGEEIFVSYCEFDELKKLNFGVDSDEIRDYTPIGTVEFVLEFCRLFINGNAKNLIKPLNVPEELFPYANGRIQNIHISDDNCLTIHNDWLDYGRLFIKSNDTIKDEINGCYNIDKLILLDEGDYQLREYIDIISEYRCFIYNDNLVGIQYYSGDFKVFPDVGKIEQMLEKYKYDYGKGSAPQAFTLDVGVDENGETFVIECHEFWSCGLYGFNDYQRLPFMFKRAFDKIKNKLLN